MIFNQMNELTDDRAKFDMMPIPHYLELVLVLILRNVKFASP